jgi:hypothetical protein
MNSNGGSTEQPSPRIAAAAQVMQTPPPPPAHVAQNSAAPSTVSTLTTSIRCHEPTPTTNETPTKRPAVDDTVYHFSPSQKKPAPDFNVTPSNDSSVISGNDKAGWTKEEAKVMEIVRKQNVDEEKEAEQLEDEEVMEFYDFEPDDTDDDDDDENLVFMSIKVS